MKALISIIYALWFNFLIVAAGVLLFILHPYIIYFYIGCIVLMFFRYALNIKIPLTKWGVDCLVSLDQCWQVVFKFLLNLIYDCPNKFGNADQTASSVVGKNLRDTGALHWKIIEFELSWLLEGGKPHSIKAIEDDEK